ncbi:MAG: glycoside hydrolase family 65 protein, partial [Actinomycetota bacterium]
MASNHTPPPTGLDPHRFPPDPWQLVETQHIPDDLGTTETLFAVANGYLGLRANPEEGRDAHAHGTYVNGFHETWEIQHAENAFGFAKVGQTIVNAPDAKLMKLYVDDEPLLLGKADLESYERSLDFRSGVLTRDLVWLTPSGKRVRVRSTRFVSADERHLAVMTFEVAMLDGSGPITISSQILNRQDGIDEYHVSAAALGEGETIADPRQARGFDHRVLVPEHQRPTPTDAVPAAPSAHTTDGSGDGVGRGDELVALGYRCANSGMTIAVAQRHHLDGVTPWSISTSVEPDHAKTVFEVELAEGESFVLTKYVSYHTSTGVPSAELADRCARTIGRAVDIGADAVLDRQRACWEAFWASSDVRVELVGDDGRGAALQQAIRWNLFQLGQATLSTHEQGVAAKAVTAGGYDGHYFWDTEIYVLPFLAVTNPSAARKLLRFRWRLLDAARRRASEMSERGALYPWRTINGEEASAYYAAGTAQYHINAAVVWALGRYLDASGDVDFLAREGAEILVETARLWDSLGFYANGSDSADVRSVGASTPTGT